MNEREFRKEVNSQIELKLPIMGEMLKQPDLKESKKAIEAVLAFWIGNKKVFYPKDVKDFLQHIYDLARGLKKDRSGIINFGNINKSPQNKIISELLTEQITPYVEQIRKEIFGNIKPLFPFNSIKKAISKEAMAELAFKKAISWIEKKGKEPLPASTKEKIEKAYMKMQEIMKAHIPFLRIGVERSVLDYPSSDGKWVKRVYATNEDLSKIREAVDIIEKATGFEKCYITIFILTGISPILRRAQTLWNLTSQDLPTGETLNNFSINIRINAKDLSFAELKTIYSSIQDKLNLVKKKPLTDKNYELYHRVKQMGGPPVKNKVSFWEVIAKEFGYGGWRQAKIAYKRIMGKII